MSIEFHFHLCFESLLVCAVSFFELANKHFHESISVHRALFSPSYFNSTLSNLTLWPHFYKRPFSFKFFFLQAWHTGQKFFGEVLQTFSNYLPSACLTLSLLIRHCRLTVVQSRRLMRSSAETYVITQAVLKGLAHTHALKGALMDNSICCVGLFFQFHFFALFITKAF